MIKYAKFHLFLILLIVFVAVDQWRRSENLYLITLGSDNVVSIYQPGSLEPAGQVPVSPGSVSIQMDVLENQLYVASAQGLIETIDLDRLHVASTVKLTENINDFVLTEDKELLVAANRNSAFLSVYSFSDNAFLTQIPVGFDPVELYIDTERHQLFAISQQDARVDVIDTISMTRQFSILLEPNPFLARKRPGKKNQLWIGHAASGVISVLNTADLEVMRRIDLSKNPSAVSGSTLADIAFSDDGGIAMIAMKDTDKIVTLDAETFQVTSYIQVGSEVNRLAVSKNSSEFYASSEAAKRLFRLNLDSEVLVKSVDADTEPHFLLLAH